MPRNPADLYTLEVPGPAAGEPGAATATPVTVLVHALTGAIDAGHAGELAATHLLDTLHATRVAAFDVDELIDYRSRRPSMIFDSRSWASYDAPEIVVDLLRDDEDVPFLLMHGVEPDLHWEAFVAATRQLVEIFGVTTTVGLQGIPMTVPHTRPVTLTAHATRQELVQEYPAYFGKVQVPTSVASLLELRLGEQGHDAVGFAVHVPHYLAQTSFPRAAAELVRQVSRATGLSLPVGELEAEAVKVLTQVEEQVRESEEVGAVVRVLETQFDAFARGTDVGVPGAGEDEQMPSADELAAQVEAFLARADDIDDDRRDPSL